MNEPVTSNPPDFCYIIINWLAKLAVQLESAERRRDGPNNIEGRVTSHPALFFSNDTG